MSSIEKKPSDNSFKKDKKDKSKQKELIQILLDSRKHHLLTDEELKSWNKLFFDHYSRTRYELCPKWYAHKTKDDFVIIWKVFKHPEKEIWRAILIPNKFAQDSLYEDPQMPIVEWVHLIEAINQLWSYIIEEQNLLFKVAKFVWLEKFSLTKSIMKSEKHCSVEIYNIESIKIPWWNTIWRYSVAIYKGEKIVWWGSFLFSIENYDEAMVEKDLSSNDEYKIRRAQMFIDSKDSKNN